MEADAVAQAEGSIRGTDMRGPAEPPESLAQGTFRQEKSQHDALGAVGRIICKRPIGWVLEADICGYFDAIVRSHLMEMIERRVKDGSILRLIGKWINVGVIDEGRLLTSETGTGQGQTISPLLANIYLHYVLDDWFGSPG